MNLNLQPFFDKLKLKDFKDHCIWENWNYRTIFPTEDDDSGKLFHNCFDALEELTREAYFSSKKSKKHVISKSCWVLMFLTLPTCIWYKSPEEEPPKKKSRLDDSNESSTWTYERLLTSDTNRSPNYINDYHYVSLADDSKEMTHSFFTEKLEKMKEHFTYSMAQRLAFGFPSGMEVPETELNEGTVEDFLLTYLYNPLKRLIEMIYEIKGLDRIGSMNYNFPQLTNYFTRTDRALRFKGQTLVVIEVKAPRISKFLLPENRKSPRFTSLVTEVFYQATSAGTPFSILSDGFISMLFIIEPNPEVNVSQTSGLTERELATEDIHVPVQIEYYVIDHETPGLTAAACHAVLFSLAYDVLINQGQLEEKQKEIWALNAQCKMSLTQKERRCNVLYNHFHYDFEKSVSEYKEFLHKLNGRNDILTMPLSEVEPISISRNGECRNSQVYAMPHNRILKVYDPYKAPHDLYFGKMTRSRAEKIALYSIKKELLAYNMLKDSKCVPDLVEYGFARVKAESMYDDVVGPYLIMEDVGREPPDLWHASYVDSVLTAYQALVQCGVLHRDLKQSNMRLVGDEERVVFFDFGVSNVDKLLALLQFAKGSTPDKINNRELLSLLDHDIERATYLIRHGVPPELKKSTQSS